MNPSSAALSWKLRRVAAGMRILDLYRETGISMTRLSEIERGQRAPTNLERRLIESSLPPLPSIVREAFGEENLASGTR